MLLGNPYVIDRPLTEGDLFVGQYQLLSRVAHALRRGSQVILVYGPSGMGKTTFLQRLATEIGAEYVVARVDLARQGRSDEEPMVQRLLSDVQASLNPALELADADLDAAMAELGDRKLAVLVDGLTVADVPGEPGAGFAAAWQDWMSANPAVRFVVSVDGTSQGSTNAVPALTSAMSVELRGLTLEETEDLLSKPARGRLTWEFGAMRGVWEMTSGHPYLVQLFGHAVFEARAGKGRIGLHDVRKVVGDVLDAARPMMEAMWQACSSEAQVLLAVANELRGRHGVLSPSDLRDAASWHGLHLDVSAIETTLGDLLGMGILRKVSGDTYSFHSDMHRLWLGKHKGLAQVASQKHFRHLVTSRRLGGRRPFQWSTIGLWLAGLAVVASVLVLWNLRGEASHLIMGSSSTATPFPVVTRADLVIGPALGNIAYTAKDSPDANWDIWVMRGDGSDPRRLTEDAGNDLGPTWSPDGKRIAFVSDRDGNKEIYVMNADGNEQIDLTRDPSEDWTPAWSPDGTMIAFSSYRDGNWEIYMMAPDGSEVTRLTQDSGADYDPSWSPNGQQLAFSSNRDGNWEIYLVSLDGAGLSRLTVDDGTDYAPAWSPDGKTIAFESYRDGNMEIYLMAPDGSEQRNITNDQYSNEHGPAWARRGARLLYYSNRDGGWDILSMKLDGTEKSNLTLSSALEQHCVWSE